MADKKKVKVIDYEAAWNDLERTLRVLAKALAESAVSSVIPEYVVGKLNAYNKVLSMMFDFEELYEEAE